MRATSDLAFGSDGHKSARGMEFEWDEDKRRQNVERYGFDFLDGVLVFADEY